MTTRTDSIAAAEKTIEQNLPTGWRKVFIEPPWRGTAPQCRGCGKVPAAAARHEKWATMAIVKKVPDSRELLYSFALCCERCGKDRKVMNRLALAVLSPADAPISLR